MALDGSTPPGEEKTEGHTCIVVSSLWGRWTGDMRKKRNWGGGEDEMEIGQVQVWVLYSLDSAPVQNATLDLLIR